MIILIWIVAIIAAYFFIVFILLRLVAPYMGFRKYELPKELPEGVRLKISELENQSADGMVYLQNTYKFVLSRWEHARGKAAVMWPKLFLQGLEKIWNTKGFIYCQTMNFVAHVLIANSKFFKAGDVEVKYVFLNFVPHQYLQIKIGDKWIDFDPAGAGIRSLPVGRHMSFIG